MFKTKELWLCYYLNKCEVSFAVSDDDPYLNVHGPDDILDEIKKVMDYVWIDCRQHNGYRKLIIHMEDLAKFFARDRATKPLPFVKTQMSGFTLG